MSMWEVVVFLLCCEGVDYNQMVATPIQTLHEHTNDVYFGEFEIFVDVHVNTTFVHIDLSIKIWTKSGF